MTSAGIRRFKQCLKIVLIKEYNMHENTAHKAIVNSRMSYFLDRDPHLVDHDSVEEWAEIIYKEYNNINLIKL